MNPEEAERMAVGSCWNLARHAASILPDDGEHVFAVIAILDDESPTQI